MFDDLSAIQDLEVKRIMGIVIHLRLRLQSAVPLESKEGFHLDCQRRQLQNFQVELQDLNPAYLQLSDFYLSSISSQHKTKTKEQNITLRTNISHQWKGNIHFPTTLEMRYVLPESNIHQLGKPPQPATIKRQWRLVIIGPFIKLNRYGCFQK